MEPRFHAVQPQGQRLVRAAACPACGYRDGFRTPLYGDPGQKIELRHRRVPAAFAENRGDGLRRLRNRSEKGYRHARHRRPPAGHRLLHSRRPAARQRESGLRHPPYPAPRRSVRLYLPRLHRTVHLPPGADARGTDGRPVPRDQSPAATHRKSDRRRRKLVPANARYGDQPARQHHSETPRRA